MAFRCSDCLSPRSSVIRADKGMAPSRPIYKCSECNATDFESALQQVRAFEMKIADGASSSVITSNEWRGSYQNLKKICHTESWYVQEAGDRLLQGYLDKLPMLVGDPAREQQTAWTALKLAEELLGTAQSSSMVSAPAIAFLSTSSFLRHQHLSHKLAKLRLFLVPDPRQSIRELQEILSSLQPYFSEDHAVVVGIKASLASAMI